MLARLTSALALLGLSACLQLPASEPPSPPGETCIDILASSSADSVAVALYEAPVCSEVKEIPADRRLWKIPAQLSSCDILLSFGTISERLRSRTVNCRSRSLEP